VQFQLTQKKLAEMITEITKAQLLTWRLGVLRNEGRATTAQISMAKRNNVHLALTVAREARQILGGMGITNEYPIMRHMMNLESVVTYEGTHDIHLLITGHGGDGFGGVQVVFPNPLGTDHDLVEVRLNAVGNHAFALFDAQGRLWKQGTLRNTVDRIDLDGILPGPYMLCVTDQDGVRRALRLVIQ
jgi:hypothetical protein